MRSLVCLKVADAILEVRKFLDDHLEFSIFRLGSCNDFAELVFAMLLKYLNYIVPECSLSLLCLHVVSYVALADQ